MANVRAENAIDVVLPRLTSVKQTAPDRWIARCPAHTDRSPSLSVRAVDGRVLLHCFAGCRLVEICGSIGIGTSALFDNRSEWHIRATKSKPPASDLLVMLDEDAHTVAVLGANFLAGRQISKADWDLLAGCVHRIGQAAALVQEFRPSWR